MNNEWLSELEICDVVDVISKSLQRLFCGTKTDVADWYEVLKQELVGKNQVVVTAVMTRYAFEAVVNDDGVIKAISLKKMDWFV